MLIYCCDETPLPEQLIKERIPGVGRLESCPLMVGSMAAVPSMALEQKLRAHNVRHNHLAGRET